MKNTFKPTAEMISTASAVLMAKAYTETIRPIVEGYQKKILDIMQPLDRRDDGSIPHKVITDIKYACMMSDEDFLIYLANCNEEREKAGLKVETSDHCPLLVAEDLERRVNRILVEVMEPITKIKADDAICSGMENYNKLIDLTLRLLTPYCKNQLFKKAA